MAGDIGIPERLVTAGSVMTESASAEPILHEYGPKVRIALASGTMRSIMETAAAADPPDDISPTERLGLEAFHLRLSEQYQGAKARRRHGGLSWDGSGAEVRSLHADDVIAETGMIAADGDEPDSMALSESLSAATGTSDRLKGRVAVAIIMVSGPTPALTLSAGEQVKVIAEVQNGLGWLGAQSPARDVTFVYETHHIQVNVPNSVTTGDYEAYEAPWRNAAMAQLGVEPGLANLRAYVRTLRTKLNTQWSFCGFFTKYNLRHFAYAGIGGPRLVMHFENDGWGIDNIDRVFAHETGHIFGAPDEYAASRCNCGGSWGFYGKPNSNCANCAPGGGVDCLMGQNAWAMCDHTKLHLGF